MSQCAQCCLCIVQFGKMRRTDYLDHNRSVASGTLTTVIFEFNVLLYRSCVQSRMFWKWEEKAKVHRDQQHQRQDLISSDEIMEFVQLAVHR